MVMGHACSDDSEDFLFARNVFFRNDLNTMKKLIEILLTVCGWEDAGLLADDYEESCAA